MNTSTKPPALRSDAATGPHVPEVTAANSVRPPAVAGLVGRRRGTRWRSCRACRQELESSCPTADTRRARCAAGSDPDRLSAKMGDVTKADGGHITGYVCCEHRRGLLLRQPDRDSGAESVANAASAQHLPLRVRDTDDELAFLADVRGQPRNAALRRILAAAR